MRKSSSPRAQAFTLMELMVVIGIIGLLIGILLPVLSAARHSANTVRCLANEKQLMAVSLLFANDHNGALPYTGWGSSTVPNWLYDPTRPPSFTVDDLKYNQLWKYVGNASLWRCPDDQGPWPAGKYQSVSSYVMNGAASGYAINGNVSLEVMQFRSDAILFWEIPFSVGQGGTSNDGTNYPPEGVAARHHGGTVVAYMDGHVDVMSSQDFVATCQPKKPNGDPNVPNSLWCDPTDKAKGGAYKFANGVYPPVPVQN